MKKLFFISVFLLSMAVQAQDYFVREYNEATTREGKVIDAPIKVEFNVFSSTDIMVRVGDLEPTRYKPTGNVEDVVIDGLNAQQLKVKAVGGGYYYFVLYEDGDLIVLKVDDMSAMILKYTDRTIKNRI